MANEAKIENPQSDLEKQKAYAESLEAKGFDYGFAVGTAFVESMRNTHYNHTGTALDELIDNSIEAGATQVCIALGYTGGSTAKPDALAVIDDGHGMPKGMLRPAAAWGGTHRHNEDTRTGFGRFGFGLPSASVNQARRFSIYSTTDGSTWRSVTVDLDEIANGDYTDQTGKVHVPQEKEGTAPPKWVTDHIFEHMPTGKLAHGTVVIWEKMDRIKWNTTKGMRDNLLQHFGVMFRNYLQRTGIKFDGTAIEPLDPLFTTPGFRYYDEDEDRAKALEAAEIDVKSKRNPETKVKISVRYAAFPPSFFSVDKSKAAAHGNQRNRFKVASDHRGIVVCRMGRQIAVVERTPWRGIEKFGNDDRYWAIEIDFPAELDEEFTIANTKQGVVMSDRIWDLLEAAGVARVITALRREYKLAKSALAADNESPEKIRPAEASMKESEKYRRTRVGGDSAERESKAREQFEQYVKTKAKEQKRPEDVVRIEAKEEEAKHPYKVEFASLPNAPFYRVMQRGGMKVLEVNTSHRFYTDVYASSTANKLLRAGIEVLLFSMGEAELDALANQDKTNFYHVEKIAWSERLEVALDVLHRFGYGDDVIDGSEEDIAAE
jgi:hypothetical protein